MVERKLEAWPVFYSIQDMPPLAKQGQRALWVDVAKGISISLVVYWHFVDDRTPINEALIFIRMPLFFFVAGLFARSAFTGSGGLIVSNKLINFIWIFLVWSAFTLIFTQPPRDLALAGYLSERAWELARIFVDPPPTLWFIYALFCAFVLVYAARSLPLVLVAGLSVAAYMWSVSDGQWRDADFLQRVIRLLPFFLIGLFSFNFYNSTTLYSSYLGPLLIVMVIPASYLVYFSDLASIGVITFALSLLGISGVAFTSRLLVETRVGRVLSAVGAASLFVYVMHRIVMFYMLTGIRIAGVEIRGDDPSVLIVRSIAAVATIAICVWAGNMLSRGRMTSKLFMTPFVVRP